MSVIRIDDRDVHYDLSGPSGAPVVAFSNPLGATLALWDAVIPVLRGRYRVLRYDTRGHGGSTATDGAVSIGDLADDLRTLMDALAIARAHLVGLSLGGMIAQGLASAEPERVLSLTLIATAAHLPGEAWSTRAAQAGQEGLGTIAEAIGRTDLRPVLHRITAPTLVIAGRADTAMPADCAEEICAGISQAEMVLLPHAVDQLPIERPDAIAAYLGPFLDRCGGARSATGAVAFETGVGNRKDVLGAEHVERSLARAGAFAGPWQDFITRAAWGEIWGDTRLPWKTRSLVTLAIMVALGHEEEFKLHVRPALRNGVDLGEFQALLLQTAIYAGVPAANGAFRWARDVLGDELDG